MNIIARLLIIAGISFLSFGFYFLWEHNNPNRLAFNNYEYTASEKQQVKSNNLPVKVSIPDQQIEVQVIPAEMNGTTWETTKDGASYLTSSPIPGETGNSVMYAHNWAGLFQKLPNVQPGNTVEVTYADNTKKTFSIAYTLEVSSGDTSVLRNEGDKRLTLYTCSGFLDSKRFVAVAMLNN